MNLTIDLPPWVETLADPGPDVERMQIAIALAEENVRRATGGPFGAVVFYNG